MPNKDSVALEASQKISRHIYTVSQLTQGIKLILESSFEHIWVEGEVSNFSAYPSGHSYFNLKDDVAIISAVMFSRANRNLKFKIENGLKVICFGKISVYEPRGQYQIVVEELEPKGIGSLQLALEQLKKKLEKEGLFAVQHKRPIPYLPSKVGIVTSAQGAAIKDILKVLERRFKDVQIIINPVRVQGEGAAGEIAQAIKDLNLFNEGLPHQERIEVMIVGRGGGSIEDLWAFNEEPVAYAIYNSRIPVISAVGHERDVTIADLVADYRAATPSVAAELVLPKKEDLRRELEDLLRRLNYNIKHDLELTANQLTSVQKKLELLNPLLRIRQFQERMEDLAKQIETALKNLIKLKLARFQKVIEKLETLSPLNILARGYSITFKMPAEEIIKDITSLKQGDAIKTRVHRGEIISKVAEIKEA